MTLYDPGLHDPRLRDARRATPLPAEERPEDGEAKLEGSRRGRRAARAQLRMHLRRRAMGEALLLAALVFLVPLLFADPLDALLGLLAAGGAALAVWIARRGNDLALAAEALRDPDRAFRARGISLKDWHGGQPLLPWAQRRAGS